MPCRSAPPFSGQIAIPFFSCLLRIHFPTGFSGNTLLEMLLYPLQKHKSFCNIHQHQELQFFSLGRKIYQLFKAVGYPRWVHHFGPKKFETLALCLGLIFKQVYQLSYRRAMKFIDGYYNMKRRVIQSPL